MPGTLFQTKGDIEMKSSILIAACVGLLALGIAAICVTAQEAAPPPADQAKGGGMMMGHEGCPVCAMMGADKKDWEAMKERWHQKMIEAGVSEETLKMAHAIKMAPMYMDSPAVLLGMSDELTLTADQKEKLQKISQQSRKDAMMVLTNDQKTKLGPVSDTPMTMMQIIREIHMKMHEMRMKSGATMPADHMMTH